MTEDSVPPLVQLCVAYGNAWNNADAGGILALHSDDSVFQMHDGSPPAIGIDAVGSALREFFAQWSDVNFARRGVHFGKESWTVEWTLTARSRGVVRGRGAAGVSVSFEGVDVVTVRNGLVATKHVYYDGVSVMKMLEAAVG